MEPDDFYEPYDDAFGYDPEFYGEYESDDYDTTEDDWRERTAD